MLVCSRELSSFIETEACLLSMNFLSQYVIFIHCEVLVLESSLV